jgi:hypothetical protein
MMGTTISSIRSVGLSWAGLRLPTWENLEFLASRPTGSGCAGEMPVLLHTAADDAASSPATVALLRLGARLIG